MVRQNKTIFGVSLLLSGAFMMGMASRPATALERDANQQGGPVIQTAEGPVRGLVNNGVYEFKGIPYATPPTGELRWRPPKPIAHWQEPLDATSFGNTCPQVTTLGVFASPASITEDCLYLNVFTTRLGSGGLPVFVWIHGGGNVDGESNDYDGSKLATGGPSGTRSSSSRSIIASASSVFWRTPPWTRKVISSAITASWISKRCSAGSGATLSPSAVTRTWSL